MMLRSLSLVVLCLLTGCPETEETSGGGPAGAAATGGSPVGGAPDGGAGGQGEGGGAPAAATHGGLLSLQDMSIHGAPQAGHGLTISLTFSESRPPTFAEDASGLGCRAWVYDVATDGVPAPTDQGTVTLAGLGEQPIDCVFDAARGYTCPIGSAMGAVTLTSSESGAVSVHLPGAAFSAGDVGAYLAIAGAEAATNNGAFPIIARPDSETLVVYAPQVEDETFDAELTMLAGVGPIPGLEHDPITAGQSVTLSLAPGGGNDFDFAPLTVSAGAPFTLDDATDSLLSAIPLDGRAISLGCGGAGGNCGESAGTVVRLTATDGDTSGLSPAAMPPAVSRQVEVQCADLSDTGVIQIPAEVMQLLADAHAESPITRIRAAFMREGVAIGGNGKDLPPNQVIALVGHGTLGFTNP